MWYCVSRLLLYCHLLFSYRCIIQEMLNTFSGLCMLSNLTCPLPFFVLCIFRFYSLLLFFFTLPDCSILLDKNKSEMLITMISLYVAIPVKLQSYTLLLRSGTCFCLGWMEVLFWNCSFLFLNGDLNHSFLYRWSFIPKRYESSRFWEVRAQLFS